MKKRYYIIILLLVCLCKYSTAQVLCIYCYDQNDSVSSNVNNLLLNGGFENGCSAGGHFCPNGSTYSCDITNWTCTGGGSFTYAAIYDSSNYSIIVEGTKAPYFGNFHCNACSTTANDTSCINNTDCTVMGIPIGYPVNPNPNYGGAFGVSLEQIVTGLITGNTYVLEFWAGGEQYVGGPWNESGLFAVDVGFGDSFLRNKPTEPITGIGTRYIVEFNAVSSSHTIKFTNWGHICDSCTELIIDDVRLYTLAELSDSVPHCSLGINEVNENASVNLYPNPITNDLTVKTNNNELSEIILYDIASRKLSQQEFTNTISLNTGQLAKGIYIYEVRNKNGLCKQGKVVKN